MFSDTNPSFVFKEENGQEVTPRNAACLFVCVFGKLHKQNKKEASFFVFFFFFFFFF